MANSGLRATPKHHAGVPRSHRGDVVLPSNALVSGSKHAQAASSTGKADDALPKMRSAAKDAEDSAL